MDIALVVTDLLILALSVAPIYGASMYSVRYIKELAADTSHIKMEEARYIPILLSATVVSLYFLIRIFFKEYINMLVLIYFSFISFYSNWEALCSVYNVIRTKKNKTSQSFSCKLSIEKKLGSKKSARTFGFEFTIIDIVAGCISALLVGSYFFSRNWMISNIIAVSLCFTMISLLKFDTLKTALVLMSALLATDVLWVFATDVMVTVASSLDIPIKIVIPISTIRKILFIGASPGARAGSSFLGLGDIVIPGIFISFCLIVDLIFHDEQLSRGKSASKILKTHSPFDFKKTYFHTSLIGYCLGLAAAFYLANAYKTGQPALLYLVPSTAVPVGLLAYVKGQLKAIYDLDTVAYYYPEGTDVGDKSPSNKSKKTSGIPDDAEPKSVTKSKTRKKALQKHEYASSEASSATLNGTRKQASQGRKKGVSATA